MSRLIVLVLLTMALAIALPDAAAATNLNEVKKLTASDGEHADQLGTSVAVSGDTAVAGAPYEDSSGDNSGAAYVFQRDQGGAGNWGEVKKLTASDAGWAPSLAINSASAWRSAATPSSWAH